MKRLLISGHVALFVFCLVADLFPRYAVGGGAFPSPPASQSSLFTLQALAESAGGMRHPLFITAHVLWVAAFLALNVGGTTIPKDDPRYTISVKDYSKPFTEDRVKAEMDKLQEMLKDWHRLSQQIAQKNVLFQTNFRTANDFERAPGVTQSPELADALKRRDLLSRQLGEGINQLYSHGGMSKEEINHLLKGLADNQLIKYELKIEPSKTSKPPPDSPPPAQRTPSPSSRLLDKNA